MFSFLRAPDDGLGVAFTDRLDGHSDERVGPLNLGRTDVDDPELVAANGRAVLEAIGQARLVAMHQVHGNEVLVVDEDFLSTWDERSWLGADGGAAPLPQADAAVTALADVVLLVRAADCVPVLLADPEAGVVGAAHAGRAGFDQGVLGNTVERMQQLGAQQLHAWIGPHICGECYEVPQQLADEVGGRHPGVVARTSWDTPSLDLGEGCRRQLVELGVTVHREDPCTRTTPTLHSHRRDEAAAGRLGGLIWRVSQPAGQ